MIMPLTCKNADSRNLEIKINSRGDTKGTATTPVDGAWLQCRTPGVARLTMGEASQTRDRESERSGSPVRLVRSAAGVRASDESITRE